MARRTGLVRLLLLIPLLAAGLAIGPPRGAAAATVCGDTAAGFEFIDGVTIKESVVVPANTECLIVNGAVVRGGVTAGSGSALTIADSEIRGSVSVNGSAYVDIADSVVRGGISVAGALGAQVVVFRNQVRADVVVTGSSVILFAVTNNTVRGSVILRDNASDPTITVASNTIDVNLDCTNNDPDPTLGAGLANTVGGAATGECAGLKAP